MEKIPAFEDFNSQEGEQPPKRQRLSPVVDEIGVTTGEEDDGSSLSQKINSQSELACSALTIVLQHWLKVDLGWSIDDFPMNISEVENHIIETTVQESHQNNPIPPEELSSVTENYRTMVTTLWENSTFDELIQMRINVLNDIDVDNDEDITIPEGAIHHQVSHFLYHIHIFLL